MKTIYKRTFYPVVFFYKLRTFLENMVKILDLRLRYHTYCLNGCGPLAPYVIRVIFWY